jgi:two-component system, OmpR family, sensor histidine kinase KdpD
MGGGGIKMPSRSERSVAVPGTGGSLDTLERMVGAPGRRRLVAGFVIATVGPVLVTVLASRLTEGRSAIPGLLYILVVVAAAAVGRLWLALLASAVSFVCLDYFFTPPTHTFAVSKAEDLFALAVFLVVAAVVSAAIATALEQRAMAEFREHQVRALYSVTSRLLSGQGLGEVLRDLAASLRGLYGLTGCRVLVAGPDGILQERASSGEAAPGPGPVIEVPLHAEGRAVGRIEMWGGSSVGTAEMHVLETFAGQLALALERSRLREEADAARVEAEASRVRAALFSSVTHDLRTPLASITASASSLLEPDVPFSDEQREELLRTILEESERLNRLVANLMDLSRLRAGALTPSAEPVPVEDLVSAVVGRLKALLGSRPLTVKIREDIPPVPMDVVQMDQVLTNLLENSVRYSPPGSPIAITAARWHDTVEVRVADRGPGIAPGDRAGVFGEFVRKDVGEVRGGTGLGLAIAHAVVAAHGGSMWIEDSPGGGATVGLRLPLTPVGRPA